MSDIEIGTINGGDALTLNVDALIGSHLCIEANSGSGKSGAIRKVLEGTHGKLQHVVLDTEDEFYTLREKFDYLIAGGDNGDCAATVSNAAALAQTILETGFSAIVQINSLSFDDRCSFISAFLSTLTAAPKRLWRPMLVVLDEAQFYAPQKGAASSLDDIVNFMLLGRKRGFTGILATPRPADLSKQATNPVNNWMIGRCGQPVDRRSAADALGFTANSAEARNLRSMVARQFWVMGPALAVEPVMAQIGKTETTIVKAGQATVPTPPAPAAMQKIFAQLNAAAKPPEEPASENAPSGRSEKGSAPDPAALKEAEERGRRQGYIEGAREINERIATIRADINRMFDVETENLPPPVNPPPRPTPSDLPKPTPQGPSKPKPAAGGPLDGAALKLLAAICRYDGITWDNACIVAGILPGNGYFYKAKKSLIEGGYVKEAEGLVTHSAAGRKANGGTGSPATLGEIVSLWTGKVGAPGGPMLKHLAKHRGIRVEIDQLSNAVGAKPGNGYWYKGVKSIRKANLIEQDKNRFSLSEFLCEAPR